GRAGGRGLWRAGRVRLVSPLRHLRVRGLSAPDCGGAGLAVQAARRRAAWRSGGPRARLRRTHALSAGQRLQPGCAAVLRRPRLCACGTAGEIHPGRRRRIDFLETTIARSSTSTEPTAARPPTLQPQLPPPPPPPPPVPPSGGDCPHTVGG